MNAEYGAKPITCPKPLLRRRVRSSYALEPVVNFDFQWAGRHPAHHWLSLAFDHDFLMTLDADLSEQHHIYCQIVDRYKCAWWKGRKPQSLNLTQVLDRSTLAQCLATHRDQIKRPFSTHSFAPATPATHSPPPISPGPVFKM